MSREKRSAEEAKVTGAFSAVVIVSELRWRGAEEGVQSQNNHEEAGADRTAFLMWIRRDGGFSCVSIEISRMLMVVGS